MLCVYENRRQYGMYKRQNTNEEDGKADLNLLDSYVRSG